MKKVSLVFRETNLQYLLEMKFDLSIKDWNFGKLASVTISWTTL